MAIRKLQNKKKVTYQVTLSKYTQGKRKRVTKVFTSKRDAVAWESEQRLQIKKGVSGLIESRKFVKNIADHWLENVVKINRAFNTYRSFNSDLRVHILPEIESRRISTINEHDIEAIRAKLLMQGKQRATVNRIMSTFKSMMGYCYKTGHTQRDPFLSYQELKIQRAEKPYWSKSDIKKFLKTAKDCHYYNLYRLALSTGMRFGEMAALTPEKVNLRQGFIKVDESSLGKGIMSTTKTKNIRFIPLSESAKKLCTELVSGKGKDELIFTSPRGLPLGSGGGINTRYFMIQQRKAKVSKELTIHDLRHTFASHYVMNGGDIFDLQKILGHNSINSTMVYAHLSPEHLKKGIDKFSLNI